MSAARSWQSLELDALELDELESVVGGGNQVVQQQLTYTPNPSPSFWHGDPGAWGHSYTVLSDPFPAGTTRAEANAYLQRFNAPTEAGLTGVGNPITATSGWVADPLTNHLPTGYVTMDREFGKVTNTTTLLHPFEGTITRSLVENEDGTYSVLTHGQGQGGYGVSDGLAGGIGPQHLGHATNLAMGPGIFAGLNDHMFSVFDAEHAITAQDVQHTARDSGGSGIGTSSVSPHDTHASDAQHTARDSGGSGIGTSSVSPHDTHESDAQHTARDSGGSGIGTSSTSPSYGGSDAQHTARDSGGSGVGTATSSSSTGGDGDSGGDSSGGGSSGGGGIGHA